MDFKVRQNSENVKKYFVITYSNGDEYWKSNEYDFTVISEEILRDLKFCARTIKNNPDLRLKSVTTHNLSVEYK